MGKFTHIARQRKDTKLSIHKATGYWCKVLKGRRHYFEKVADDPDGSQSLKQWLEVRKGNAPHWRHAFLVKDAAEAWIQDKKQKLDSGEIIEGRVLPHL